MNTQSQEHLVATGVVLTHADSIADLNVEQRPDNHDRSSWAINEGSDRAKAKIRLAAQSIENIVLGDEDDAVDLQYAYNALTHLAASDSTEASIASDLQVAAGAANALRDICHGDSFAAGWWINHKTGADARDNPMCFSQKLCLIHSEISEAMEGDRKSLQDTHLPNRYMREVELADALIRIFDLAGAYGMDIGGALAEKLEYNRNRLDHKLSARSAEGGKAY